MQPSNQTRKRPQTNWGIKSFLIRVIWNASSQHPKPGLSLLAPIVVREAHRGDPQQVSIQQPKHITQYSEADYWKMLIYTAMCIVEITVLAVGLRKQLEPGERHSFFFCLKFARASKSEQNPMMSLSEQLSSMKMKSLEENARSLIVNYHCEASNHGRGNSTKRLFSPSTHSRFLEVLSESINFAAQGLCEGTPVVSRSCRCSEQIGCIFE